MINNPLIKALDEFSNDFKVIAESEKDLLGKKDILEKKLEAALLINNQNINQESTMAKLTNTLKISVKKDLKDWNEALKASLPMKVLSEQFADRIILLVFGKVNAGKSSFCNFLAEQFNEQQVKRFCFKKGEVEYFKKNEKFAEGIVETTATIQGIELGSNLVLLDSPGLHSVKGENGALTRQYADCADAVLWLSPSTSPGQVQELHDLKSELEKKKPLQPVITRSDEIFEDYCEIQDDIIQEIKNKTEKNRKLQEDDVLYRVNQLQLHNDVKKCISISVHTYQKSNKKQEDLQQAGLYKLFESLVVIIDEAKDYKVKKANQQVINFLREKVLKPLESKIIPEINELMTESKEKITYLNKNKIRFFSEINAEVAYKTPLIINTHKDSQNKQAIAEELNSVIEIAMNTLLERELSALIGKIKKVSSTLSSNELGDFKDITIDIRQTKGALGKAASAGVGGLGGAWGGAEAGALLGSMVPVVGTVVGGVIGGFLGGFLGSAAGGATGDYFVETEIVKEKVDVSTEEIIQKITLNMKKILPTMIEISVDDVIQTIKPIQQFCYQLLTAINEFKRDVEGLQKQRN